MSCYQLIKTMTQFEKRTNQLLSAERFENVVMNAEKPSSLLNKLLHNTERAQNGAYCPITSTDAYTRCPINAQIRRLIANHIREFCYSFDYNVNTSEKQAKIWLRRAEIYLSPISSFMAVKYRLVLNCTWIFFVCWQLQLQVIMYWEICQVKDNKNGSFHLHAVLLPFPVEWAGRIFPG